jgi:hypothetical protein
MNITPRPTRGQRSVAAPLQTARKVHGLARPRALFSRGPGAHAPRAGARRCSSSRTLRAPARTSTTWRTRWRCARRASATCCPPWTRRAPASVTLGCLACVLHRARWLSASILHRACWLCLCCGHAPVVASRAASTAGRLQATRWDECLHDVGAVQAVQRYRHPHQCCGAHVMGLTSAASRFRRLPWTRLHMSIWRGLQGPHELTQPHA